MGSTAATFEERQYNVDTFTGVILLKPERMMARTKRWGDDTYLTNSYGLIERWVVRALTRRDFVRVGAVLAKDCSDEPDLFIRDLLGVRWSVRAVKGPIPGLRPGAFVPLANRVTALAVPVLKGAVGWDQGPSPATLQLRELGQGGPTVELDLDLARRVAKRAHAGHGDHVYSLDRCAEPDCIAIREALA